MSSEIYLDIYTVHRGYKMSLKGSIGLKSQPALKNVFEAF